MTMIAETAGGQGSWGLEADREGGPASEGKISPRTEASLGSSLREVSEQ